MIHLLYQIHEFPYVTKIVVFDYIFFNGLQILVRNLFIWYLCYWYIIFHSF